MAAPKKKGDEALDLFAVPIENKPITEEARTDLVSFARAFSPPYEHPFLDRVIVEKEEALPPVLESPAIIELGGNPPAYFGQLHARPDQEHDGRALQLGTRWMACGDSQTDVPAPEIGDPIFIDMRQGIEDAPPIPEVSALVLRDSTGQPPPEPPPADPFDLAIKSVKSHHHFSTANAGLYWVRIEFSDGSHTSANLMNLAQARALMRVLDKFKEDNDLKGKS